MLIWAAMIAPPFLPASGVGATIARGVVPRRAGAGRRDSVSGRGLQCGRRGGAVDRCRV